ncbi:MAG: DUF4919 domain-containing protein [Candidatus Andeanibacterium colombiense]|uniref:DUF4919 domain-containing protein n=1 Tax=Candidatus Andeanibacterium colombiense TaxID=3121345 RepID=A0AAJ6BQZ8_9SPHN|nr:MAG: DUF4919 domain-containing protein [Sphingomonadaceae bacterium]
MIRQLRPLGLALALAAGVAFAAPALAEAEGFNKPGFEAALAAAKAHEADVDFAWLRHQNLLRLDYAIPDWDKADEAFGEIDTRPQKALDLAREQLALNYFDLFAHVVSEQSLTKLGQTEAAKAEHATVVALLASIVGGKDGLSAEHAFTVVSISEEYQTLALIGLDVKNQAFANTDDGHAYDVLEASDPDTGETHKIWFGIDAFFSKELAQ